MKTKTFSERIRDEFKEYLLLLRSVPGLIMALFIVSAVGMNLLANKSIDTGSFTSLALDCGILLSWLAFLSMDIIVKRFGPKAATEISVTATVVNLVLCGVFFIASLIPGVWGESFVDNGESINVALNNTFGGTWYVLFGSTIAFLVSSIVNNFSNHAIGKIFSKHKGSFGEYAARSYISTMIGQFVDNLIFALIVSYNFFGWSLTQCFMCALTGAVVELLCEIIFSPFGFKVCRSWDKNKVGEEYLKHRRIVNKEN